MKTKDEVENVIKQLMDKIIDTRKNKRLFDMLVIVAKANYLNGSYDVDVVISDREKKEKEFLYYYIALHEISDYNREGEV